MPAVLTPSSPVVKGRQDTPASSRTAGVEHALRRSPLFADLSTDELAEVVRAARRHVLPSGPARIEGESTRSLFLVVSGRLDITLTSTDGRELILYRLAPGDFFGETALLPDQPRTAFAIARTRCELIGIPDTTLLAALARHPELAHRLIMALLRRLSAANDIIRAATFLGITSRLARLLIAIDDEQGGGGTVRVSQAELANALGCMRQSITRTIAGWRRSGWVATGRGYVIILQRHILESYTDD